MSNPTASSPIQAAASDPTERFDPIPDTDERLQVLRLLENGEITADEADQLLDALDADSAAAPASEAPPTTERTQDRDAGPATATPIRRGQPQLRIRISDTVSGKARVNLTIPLGFLDAGYRLARRIVPGRVPDAESFHSAIRDGFRGHLIDVVEGNERVEILVE